MPAKAGAVVLLVVGLLAFGRTASQAAPNTAAPAAFTLDGAPCTVD
jgi:hypothetical protein